MSIQQIFYEEIKNLFMSKSQAKSKPYGRFHFIHLSLMKKKIVKNISFLAVKRLNLPLKWYAITNKIIRLITYF